MKSDIKMIAMGCKPDPYKFKITHIEHYNDNTIIKAVYEGCLTFGGDKLMLLKGWYCYDDFETLDPHFLDEKYAVIARFIPNEDGWKMARICAMIIN
jgi:hypothetical protein